MSSRKVLIGLLSVLLVLSGFTWAFGKTIELTYMYWGSPEERVAQENMLKDFEEAYQDIFPGIKAKALHVPSNYEEKISSMVAGGTPPHVAQVEESLANGWAEAGVFLNILPLIEKDPDPSIQIENRLSETWHWYDGGKKIYGSNLSPEAMVTWYNKDIFDANNVPYPPSEPKEWTWDLFLETAIQLTTDRNGKHPNEEGFDPEKIKTYGVMISNLLINYLSIIWSNGGDVVDETGTKPLIGEKEAIEAMQLISDLIHVHHVAPSSTQVAGLPATYVALQTKQVAMVLDGQWLLLDLGKMAQQGRLNLGVAPYPCIKEPVCFIAGSPNAVFVNAVKDDPEILEATWELYKWCTDSEKVLPLIQSGLWMPLQKKWYTEPEYIEKWLTPGIHPPEYKEAVIDYLLEYGRRDPGDYMRNWDMVEDIMFHEMDGVFSGRLTAEEACKNVAKRIEPHLQGRVDR